jgi:hypothetical protein
VFVTSQGSARTQFRRALRSGDPMLVLSTAAELERVQLVEAFAIVLVLADTHGARHEKAAARLVARGAQRSRRDARGRRVDRGSRRASAR